MLRLLPLGLLLGFLASCGAPSVPCDSTTCSTGCCDAEGQCQTGLELNACGTPGTQCLACDASQVCNAGICSAPAGAGGGSGATGGGGGSTGGGGGTTGGGGGGSTVGGGGGTTGGGGGPTGTGGGVPTGGGGGPTGGGSGTTGGGSGTTGGGSGTTGGGGGTTGGGSGASDGGVPSCSNITGDRRTQVCLRWTCDRADMSEGMWSGAVMGCNAGDLSATGRANALKILNLYRFIADLPAVTTSAMRDQSAQECALMMDAANMLSHTPATSWACYTAAGADAASKSNISSGQAVRSIDMYMSDYGTSNALSLGHRRWFLSNQLGPVGIGGTTGGSCHWVINGTGTAGKRFAAWPPPGPVPLAAINIPTVASAYSVDFTGWSVQTYATADNLTDAGVVVTDNGTNLPVNVFPLGANYGSRYAIRFVPNGWRSQAGHTYQVTVTAPAMANPISYAVEVVSCP